VIVTRGGDGSPAWDNGFVWSITFASNTSRALPLGDLTDLAVDSTGCTEPAYVTYTASTLKDGVGYAGDCVAANLQPLFSFKVSLYEANTTALDNATLDYGYRVAHLTPGNTYFARVAAVNLLGVGDFSPYWVGLGAPDAQAASPIVPMAVPSLVRSAALVPTMAG
jgi:hypothetical protein